MSRLCVKGLAKAVTENDLREFFSRRGEVTDVRIIRNKKGISRQFGFVGFRTAEAAKDAMEYLNGTYIKTTKITITEAKAQNDPELQATKRAKQEKRQPAETKGDDEPVRDAKKPKDKKEQNSSMLKEEFLEVMKPRSSAKFWANDDISAQQASQFHGNLNDSDSDAESEASDESYNDVRKIPTQKRSRFEEASDSEGDDDEADDGRSEDEDDSDDEADESVGQQRKQKGTAAGNDEGKTTSVTTQVQEVHADDAEDARDSGRLFVRNLPFTATEEELKAEFEGFGAISELHIPLDEDHRHKGFAFVQFMFPDDAAKAMQALDGTSFQGRLLHVIAAKRQRKAEPEPEELASRSSSKSDFKLKKELERKRKAQDSIGWNASYIRADTVVDTLAQRYGVAKSDIMDRNEGDMAVRLALGETQLIQENRQYLKDHGVDISVLESFNSNAKPHQRSNTTILVKNLPADTDSSELSAMFSRHGSLAQLVLPPSKSIALVEFTEPSEARAAFKALAYRSYKHVPIYLEWAPTGVITTKKRPGDESETSAPQNAERKSDDAKPASQPTYVDEGDATHTLYVKNLNFETTEEQLRNHVQRIGAQGIRAVSIPLKEKNQQKLSMGFGFVEFDTWQHTQQALALLNQSNLDGHVLEAKASTKRLTAATTVAPALKKAVGKPTTKIIVRNVAFQATAKEIRSLFGSFGQIKTVRLPKKFDGTHRGFAFVEFLTTQEALQAMQTLSGTHLYGRHLVLEWANADDESMDALRKKASSDVKRVASNKKRRIDDFIDEMDGL